MTSNDEKKIIFREKKHLTSDFPKKYIQYKVDVPENISKFGLVFKYFNEFSDKNPKKEVMFISIHDPNKFRGHCMNPGGRGDVVLELWTKPDSASEGAIPGKLPAGKWMIQIDIRALTGETDFSLEVYIQEGKVPEPLLLVYPNNHVVKSRSGWYKGELHAHSTESDGKYPVEKVIEAAINYELDFFSLTDHSTCSQWHKFAKLQNSKMAIIRSLEITSHVGHANLHGIKEYVNTYIDQTNWSANQAAKEVHEQGGLFCVNHAFSGLLSWRDFSLDWRLVDLEEIYHNLEGANNSYQLLLWDQHLSQGYRIVGVGGTDSHDPFQGIHELGQVVTWVYADELSERGIIDGLKRGYVYISRGPEFRFLISNASGETAMMWESLKNDGTANLKIRVKWDKPLSLFIVKNGLILDVLRTTGKGHDKWETIYYKDPQPINDSYYRIELHDETLVMPYSGIIWRDYSTMRILSNPIWIERISSK